MGNGGPWAGAPLLADGLLGEERDDVGVEVVDGVLRDGVTYEGVVVGLVVADLEAEAFEERPKDVVGGSRRSTSTTGSWSSSSTGTVWVASVASRTASVSRLACRFASSSPSRSRTRAKTVPAGSSWDSRVRTSRSWRRMISSRERRSASRLAACSATARWSSWPRSAASSSARVGPRRRVVKNGSPRLPSRLRTVDPFLAGGVVSCRVGPLEVVGSGPRERVSERALLPGSTTPERRHGHGLSVRDVPRGPSSRAEDELGFRWGWHGLADIHHKACSAGKDVHHGDHGAEQAP